MHESMGMGMMWGWEWGGTVVKCMGMGLGWKNFHGDGAGMGLIFTTQSLFSPNFFLGLDDGG